MMKEKLEFKFVLDCSRIYEKKAMEILYGLEGVVEALVPHPSDPNFVGIPFWVPHYNVSTALMSIGILLGSDATGYVATRGESRKTFTQNFYDDMPSFKIREIGQA